MFGLLPPSSSEIFFTLPDGEPHDLLAGRRLAGEGDLADARVGRDRRAGRAAGPGHDVEDAGRDARLERQLAEPDRRQRRVRRGLQDRGVARRPAPARPSSEAISSGKFHGTISPTTPIGSRSVRSRPGFETGIVWPKILFAAPGVVVEDEARADDLAAGAGDRLADVAALELGQLLAVLLDAGRRASPAIRPRLPAAQFAQPLRSSKAVCAAATARSTSARPPSGAVAIVRAGGRIDDVERLAVGRLDGLAADDHPGVGRRVGCVRPGPAIRWSCGRDLTCGCRTGGEGPR